MTAFFLSFLACLLATLAGRDAARCSRLASAHGRAGMLLAACLIASFTSAAVAAWMAQLVAPVLPGAAGRLFVGIALAITAGEVLFLRAGKAPAEPTQSFGATLIVLLATLLTGASGFLILALSAMTRDPILAGLGGGFGVVAALVIAVLAEEYWEKLPQNVLRFVVGSALGLAALITSYNALT